jgi:hypothetical protein
MEGIRYVTVHNRLSRQRGPARAWTCVLCPKQAQEWSYDHRCPNERIEHRNGKAVPFSEDLDRYQPVCKGCHSKRDRWGVCDWPTCMVEDCTTLTQLSYCTRHWVGPQRAQGLPLGRALGTDDEDGRRRNNGRRTNEVVATFTHKECKSCNKVKSVAGFSTRGTAARHRPDPYKAICLVCDRVRANAWYQSRYAR